jgi:hypothetical protein
MMMMMMMVILVLPVLLLPSMLLLLLSLHIKECDNLCPTTPHLDIEFPTSNRRNTTVLPSLACSSATPPDRSPTFGTSRWKLYTLSVV